MKNDGMIPTSPEERHHLIRVLVAAVNISLGAVFLWGSLDRFSAPAWDPLLAWTSGNVNPFGVVIGISGIGLLAINPVVRAVAAFISINWHSALAANFVIAAVMSPEASTTGIVAYVGFMGLSGILLSWEVPHLRAALRR